MSLSVEAVKNPTCPRIGMRVKCVRADDSMFNRIGTVAQTLVNGHSYIVNFPMDHGGKLSTRLERDSLEVIEDDKAILENIYHRYARVRINALIEALEIIMVSANMGDAITLIAREIGHSVPGAFSREDGDDFLRDNGLPNPRGD